MTSKDRIELLGRRVVVALAEQVGKTKGGIIIPETARNKPLEGFVIGLGDGKQDTGWQGEWPPFKKGDRVLFGRYAGTEVQLEDTGEEIRILGIDEILGVVHSQPGSK